MLRIFLKVEGSKQNSNWPLSKMHTIGDGEVFACEYFGYIPCSGQMDF